jgi:uncharacterized protein DUF6983
MTTMIPFQPTATQVFTATVTLDGQQYSLIVTWNLAGRWYMNLYTLDGQLILCRALVGSPSDSDSDFGVSTDYSADDINLVQQYFTTSQMVYREETNTFEVTP